MVPMELEVAEVMEPPFSLSVASTYFVYAFTYRLAALSGLGTGRFVRTVALACERCL